MKNLLFFFFLTLSCFAQDTNFMVKNNVVVWENVYITNETNIPETLGRHPRLLLEPQSGNLYKGKGAEIKNTCPGVSVYMDNEMSFRFEAEKSDGKYRVTVYDIKFNEKGGKAAIEKYLLNKGNFKKTDQAKADMQCLDSFFKRMFTLTQALKNKS